jgi:hypothetical protein
MSKTANETMDAHETPFAVAVERTEKIAAASRPFDVGTPCVLGRLYVSARRDPQT